MRLLRSLHAWTGLVLSVLIAILGVSGAVLVFKDDYLRATIPAAREEAPLDAGSLAHVAHTADRLFPGEIRTLVFAKPDHGLYRVYLTSGGGAYLDARGDLVDRWAPGGRIEVWLFDLHHDLLAGDLGHTVGGVLALLAVAMAVTGFVIWVPAARSFAWRLWPRSTMRRDLLVQHRDLGLLAAGPIVLLALTGAAMVFHTQALAVLSWVVPGSSSSPAPSSVPTAAPGEVDWAAALLNAQRRFPDALPRIASWPSSPGQPAAIRLKQPAEWHPNGRTRVSIDPASGTVIEASDAMAEPGAVRAYNALYPLHSAAVGGRTYDAMAFFGGLALFLLSTLGAWSFLKRLRR